MIKRFRVQFYHSFLWMLSNANFSQTHFCCMHGYANTMFYLKFFEQAGEPMVDICQTFAALFAK